MRKYLVQSLIVILSIFHAKATFANWTTSSNYVAPRKLELGFIKAALTQMYGEFTPQEFELVEELYDQDHKSIMSMLSGGYLACMGIHIQTEAGLERKTLLDENLPEITNFANRYSDNKDQPITEDEFRSFQTIAVIYLCPEYY